MQAVSELWTQLFRKGAEKEYAFDIDGVWYGPEEEVEHTSASSLFNELGIGNAFCSSLKLTVVADEIPKGATIKRFVRLRHGDEVSEYIPKGVFFVNRRQESDSKWTVEAFDVMRKTEQELGTDGDWPRPMMEVTEEIAARIGVDVDSRTVINESYMFLYPANFTMREALQHIAAAHGGNFVITDEGKLRLVVLGSEPEETNYLVTQHGDPITFGGVRILVG